MSDPVLNIILAKPSMIFPSILVIIPLRVTLSPNCADSLSKVICALSASVIVKGVDLDSSCTLPLLSTKTCSVHVPVTACGTVNVSVKLLSTFARNVTDFVAKSSVSPQSNAYLRNPLISVASTTLHVTLIASP